MSRVTDKERLFFALGQLFGPVLRMIESPDQYDADEQARILARFFHDCPELKRQADAFFRGEKGHDYLNHRHHFGALMARLVGGNFPMEQVVGAIPEVARELRAVVSSVPVPLDAAVREARTGFSTYALVRDLCRTAQQELIWADRYFDHSIFHRYLRDSSVAVQTTLVTWPSSKATGKADVARVGEFMDVSRLFAKERGPQRYRLVTNADFHDRLLCVDRKMFVLGGSIKDLGMETQFTIAPLEPSYRQKFDDAIRNGIEVFGPSQSQHP